jgi:hypothetical protein
MMLRLMSNQMLDSFRNITAASVECALNCILWMKRENSG